VNKIQANVRRGLEALEFAADQRRRLVLDLRETLRNEGITVDVDERNGVVRLTEQAVRFAPNDFHLIGAARENVIRIARALGRVISQLLRAVPTRPTSVPSSAAQPSTRFSWKDTPTRPAELIL
jgi:hypothetical protein